MALTAATGLNLGKIYPAIQSGTAVFTAGVVVVQYPQPFKSVPIIMAQAYSHSGGTAIPLVIPSGVSTTQASLTGYEINGAGAGTLSGTIAAGTVSWIGYIDN